MVARTASAAEQQQQQRQRQHPHDKWWDPQNEHNKAAFMDWIESMDFFGCDENVRRNVFHSDHQHSTRRIDTGAHQATDLERIDYTRLHDQLLESLMAEQSKKANEPENASDIDSSASSFSFSSASLRSFGGNTLNRNNSGGNLNGNASLSAVNSSFDSYGEQGSASDMSLSSKKTGCKRPRALKLSRKVMPILSSKNSSNSKGSKEEKTMKRKLSSASSNSSNKSNSTNVSISSKRDNGKKSRPESGAVSVSLSDLNEAEVPPAAAFIHPQCRLQKDKGKGEAPGANICAKGRGHCLLKLEQKIALLTRVAFGEENKNKGGTADMKQRPARVAEVFSNFTETRSIIELRMGFMSMQYGILLRWDTTRTGKVTLVVLRKMCSESFYTKCKAVPRKKLSAPRKMLKMPMEMPSSSLRNVVGGNHAILQRPDGMEVALLEPPYRVDRPDVFPNSLLSVSVQHGSGLSRKSSWTVQLCYDTKTENILLTWDAESASFTPKLGESLKHEIPMSGSLDLPSLEIRLFEHRQKRGKPRRCVSHMHVPLLGLDAQPKNQKANPQDVKVISTHDPDASITLSVLLESDYAHWLRHELDARRREEVKGFAWKGSFRVSDFYDDTPPDAIEVEEEEEYDGIWEWICGAC